MRPSDPPSVLRRDIASLEVARIREALLDLSRVAERAAETTASAIEQAGRLIGESLRAGGTVFACGNGGSAADAQHFVAEFVGRLYADRAPLRAVTLSVDPSIVTALSNDYGYAAVFARQVEALARPGDVLVGISTSGRSDNVLRAFEEARKHGVRTVALVGEGGDVELELSDVVVRVPSTHTGRIQEIHTAALHAMCECAERTLMSNRLREVPMGTQGERSGSPPDRR